ncbi:MAG: PIN domain-containing protein [Kiritimatiellae bacterium]|nr:PIN domain-containing protein [Kiritimatiellia bacterium]
MTTVPKALKGVRDAVFDTMVLIYLLEDHPTYAPVCESLFGLAEAGSLSGVITPITLAEVIVKPLKAGQPELADRYQNAIRNLPNITLGELSWKTGIMAGALRAKYGLALPDLFQAACAIERGGVLITNDKALKRVEEIRVVLLNDLL